MVAGSRLWVGAPLPALGGIISTLQLCIKPSMVLSGVGGSSLFRGGLEPAFFTRPLSPCVLAWGLGQNTFSLVVLSDFRKDFTPQPWPRSVG